MASNAFDQVASFATKLQGAATQAAEGATSVISETLNAARGKARDSDETASKRPIEHIEPDPLLDEREESEFVALTNRIEKLEEPGALAKLGEKVGSIVPLPVKNAVGEAADAIQAQRLYSQALDVVASGFKVVEEQAARFSVGSQSVLEDINKALSDEQISTLDEICLLRSYDVARIAHASKMQHLGLAFAEGAMTGAPGFAGLPFNLVLSTFLYYRSVQSIAMYYGYNVKEDPAELIIAGEVFMRAMSPSDTGTDGIASAIGKVMLFSEVTAVKQTVKKGWAAMAQRGGIPLLIAQMRALANAAAKKAVAKAGQKGLENSAFRSVFEQVGKRLGQKAVGRAVPIVGGAIGALFDTGQMNAIVEYADLFYHKRFILEKGYRIDLLLGNVDPEISVE